MGAENIAHVYKPWTEEEKAQLLEMVTEGKPFAFIANYFGLSRYGFYLELGRHPQLRVAINSLREHSTHDLVDGLIGVVSNPELDSRVARNIMQATQFVVAAKNRKDYGSRVDINVHKTIDFRSVLDAADARVVLEHAPQLTGIIEESTAIVSGLEPDTSDHPLKLCDRSEFEDLL